MKQASTQFPLFDAGVSEQIRSDSKDQFQFSDYIVYVDESGDHNLKTVDDKYPVFVLAFCIFHKRHYAEVIVPALEKFKFNYFGHDQIILHEHEIRKELGAFTLFRNRAEKEEFLSGLGGIIERSNFILASCTIDKRRLINSEMLADNPYNTALGLCMETLYDFLREKGQESKKTHVVVECRGKKEDKELELEFRRICDGNNRVGLEMPFEILFSDKKAMSTGLQLADLVARPIGLNTVRPTQENRAFEVLKRKYFCEGGRKDVGNQFEGIGMKIYPPYKAKSPSETH